jgi:hypothetical protein
MHRNRRSDDPAGELLVGKHGGENQKAGKQERKRTKRNATTSISSCFPAFQIHSLPSPRRPPARWSGG